MANFTFDVARGREVEFYSRVDSNDPTNSALVIVVLAYATLEVDATLRTYATLSAVLANSFEVTNTNYLRKTLTDASLSAYTVDTSNHSITLPLPTQTFSNIATGDTWGKALVCYDSDTTSGTDTNIIPVTAQDVFLNGYPVSPAANDIVFSWPNGLLIA